MLVHIARLLDEQQLAAARDLLSKGDFHDGKLTAGQAARKVKNNLELSQQSQWVQALNNLVMTPLVSHPLFQSAVLPQRIATPIYARYTKGMSYGYHIDDPVMGGSPKYRSDVSFTIFLNNPDEYEGGDLEIQTTYGSECYKLTAGDVVVYPSSSLHRVREVTAGTRLVAISWIQSMIRDPARREILHNMNQAREQLLQEKPDESYTGKLDNAYANLVRMWADP